MELTANRYPVSREVPSPRPETISERLVTIRKNTIIVSSAKADRGSTSDGSLPPSAGFADAELFYEQQDQDQRDQADPVDIKHISPSRHRQKPCQDVPDYRAKAIGRKREPHHPAPLGTLVTGGDEARRKGEDDPRPEPDRRAEQQQLPHAVGKAAPTPPTKNSSSPVMMSVLCLT